MKQIRDIELKPSFMINMDSWKLAVLVMPLDMFISKETEKAIEVTCTNKNTKKTYKMWFPKSVVMSITK